MDMADVIYAICTDHARSLTSRRRADKLIHSLGVEFGVSPDLQTVIRGAAQSIGGYDTITLIMQRLYAGESNRIDLRRKITDVAFATSPRALDPIDLSAPDWPAMESLIGMIPTRRLMMVHSDGIDCAILDHHVLMWLRNQGYEGLSPTTIGIVDPDLYHIFEEIFIMEAMARNLTCLALDTMIIEEASTESESGDSLWDMVVMN